MIAILVPVWIIGGAFLAIIVLSSMFNSGTSAMSNRPASLRPDGELDGRLLGEGLGTSAARLPLDGRQNQANFR